MNFEEQTQCLNCEQPISTQFCAHCGQEKAQRLSLKQLKNLFISGFIEMQSPFLRMLIDLMLHPLQTSLNYINGQRNRYFNPLKFSFWILTIILFSAFLLQVPLIPSDMFNSDNDSQQSLLRYLENTLIYQAYIYCFFITIFFKFVCNIKRYNFSEIYVSTLLFYIHNVIVTTPFLFLGMKNSTSYVFLSTFILLLYFVYLFYHLSPKEHTLLKNTLKVLKVLAALFLAFVFYTVLLFFTSGVFEGFEHTTLTS